MSRSYGGLDRFRLAAALLVVAIHLSPLSSVNETADFLLTRVLARVAVPFFLCVSGFFLLRERRSLKRPLLRLGLLYLLGTLVYLPFSPSLKTPSPLGLLRDLLVDGTFYHLWYFPAAIVGLLLARLLLRLPKPWLSLGAALLLYLTGLLGDSYYGLGALRGFFEVLFRFSSYTRNGLFFAPLFLLMGAWMARRKRLPLKIALPGLALSLLLMAAEALTLRAASLQRHDSMYLLLPLCVYFLFQCLLACPAPGSRTLRSVSLLLYLLHPMVLLFLRGFARAAGLWDPLIENSLIRYSAVSLLSLLAALLPVWLLRRREPLRDRAWLEIDLARLAHNTEVLRALLPSGCRLMAVLKANAYGHGDLEMAKALNRLGVRSFAVATAEEGIRLRRRRIRGEILVLGCTDPGRARQLHRYRLTQTAADPAHARALSAAGVSLKIHLAVDTGMHRLGTSSEDRETFLELFSLPSLKITGIYTHLCAADQLDPASRAYTLGQITRFRELLLWLEERGVPVPPTHVQSSYGLLNCPGLRCNYARIGIALYGAKSQPGETKTSADLRPVLSLRARVVMLRELRVGEHAGYGCAFTAERDTRLAVLPVGYADGIPRALSCGGGAVLLHGKRAPILGRVCMDQLLVDVTEIPEVQVGDTAILIGEQLPAEEVAQAAGTIANELLSRLGGRLERVYQSGKEPLFQKIGNLFY